MTDTTITTEPTDDASTDTVDTTTAPPVADDATDDDSTQGSTSKSAQYRRRAQAAEGERDALRSQLDAVRTAEVLRLAGDRLVKPEALLTVGETILADLLDDNGAVDPAKVEAAVTAAIDSFGMVDRNDQRLRGGYVPGEGSNPRAVAQKGWETALQQS